ncbi:MAG: VCBS repeat-containing protein, partial [Candidatus Omnitrophica bacterium]|nr:VCBS repeat-containing protein [Candidatus Omnitrophota bacterium]
MQKFFSGRLWKFFNLFVCFCFLCQTFYPSLALAQAAQSSKTTSSPAASAADSTTNASTVTAAPASVSGAGTAIASSAGSSKVNLDELIGKVEPGGSAMKAKSSTTAANSRAGALQFAAASSSSSSPVALPEHFVKNFSFDSSSGAPVFTLPIELPPGRKGVAPSLSLIYSPRSGNGPLGMGWQVGFPVIERSLKNGVPQYTSTDAFVSTLGGGAQELVNVSGKEYRAKVQGDFTKYIFDGTTWIAYDRTGNTYYFGLKTLLQDNSVEQQTPGKVLRWRLSEVKDMSGNYHYIRYLADGAFEVLYTGEPGSDRDSLTLSSHKFFGRVVGVVETARRPDVISSNATGFTQEFPKRLTNISVYANGSLQRRYAFDYTLSRRTGRSLLTKVTQYGADNTTTLPPVTLTYNDDASYGYTLSSLVGDPTVGDNLWNCQSGGGFDRGRDSFIVAPFNPEPSWRPWQTSNWNRDDTNVLRWSYPLGNLFISSPGDTVTQCYTYVYVKEAKTVDVSAGITVGGGAFAYFINDNISADQAVSRYWNLKAGYNRVFLTAQNQDGGYQFNTFTEIARYVDLMNSTQVMQPQFAADFNGDGITDAMTPFKETGVYKVALSDGVSFLPKQTWMTDGGNYGRDRQLLLGDFNGDGRIDLLSFKNLADAEWRVALSDGTKFVDQGVWLSWFTTQLPALSGDFNGDRKTDIAPVLLSGGHKIAKIALTKNNSFVPTADMDFGVIADTVIPLTGDFNGDGLTDFAAFDSATGGWKIYVNPGDLSKVFTLTQAITGFGANQTPVVADFNGDGITDIGYFEKSTGKIYYKTFQANGFSDSQQFPVNFLLTGEDVQVQAADFNGDGLMDFYVYNSIGQQQIAYANGGMSDLLTKFDNGVGAATELTYVSSTQKSNTYLPYAMPLLSRVKVSDGRGNSYATDYDYSQGLWSAADAEFMGFGKVTVKDADGNWEEMIFDQSDIYRRGLLLTSAFYSSDGSLFNKTINSWSLETLYNTTPEVKFVKLDRTDNYLFDGNATGKRTAVENYYGETPQCGNVTKSINLGEVDLATGDDVGNDALARETQYHNISTATYQILGLPKYTTLKDGNNAVLTKSWLYYDGNADFNAAPLIGYLTKTKTWAGPNAVYPDPETGVEYDVYGNVVKTISPAGKVAAVTYDTAWHLFPIQTKNALGYTEATAYYGVGGVAADNGLWGQVKSVTDANLQSDLSIYDTFGRKIKYVSPLDTMAKPTNTAQVDYFSNYSRVTNRKRVISGEDGMIKTVEFFDGFGRMIESKAPTATEGQFIVSGQGQYDLRGLPRYQYSSFLSTASQDEIDPIFTTNPRSKTDYDPAGRPIQITSPDGTFANVVYDDGITTTIDPNGHKQESVTDSRGNLVEKREYSGADGRSTAYPAQAYTLYATTKYDYDLLGHLVKTTDAKGNQVTITYDILGRKIGMKDPDMGTWQYVYDLEGNLISQTDAKGQKLEFTYDALNRLVNKTDHGNVNVTYTYDAPNVAFSIGRLTQVDYKDGETTFTYDNIGREVTSTKTIDGQSYTVRRTYDDLGNLRDVTYPNGDKIYYRYNAAGQPDGVANDPALLKSAVKQIKTTELADCSIPSAAWGGLPAVRHGAGEGVFHLLEILLGVSTAEAASSDATFLAQNVPTVMRAGSDYAVSVTMKNTGATTWSATSQIRLGAQNPHDNTQWGFNRVNLLPGETVSSGGQKIFTFTVTAPSTAGTYNFQWRMLQENIEWFGDTTPNVSVNVLPGSNSKFMSQNVPASMNAGNVYTVSVTMKNTGTTAWNEGGQFRLGTQNPGDNTQWGFRRVSLTPGETVPPGGQKTFTFAVTAPSTAGTYNFQWRMLQENVEWFGEVAPNIVINVISTVPPQAAKFISQSAPDMMIAGQTYPVTVVMQNTGSSPWVKSQSFRLASQNYPGNDRWGLSRIELPKDVIDPGETVSFTFNVTAPASPSAYNFQWKMLQEGVQWFGEITPNKVINVVPAVPPQAAKFISQSAPDMMIAGQTYPVTVVMQNTGSSPWVKSQSF